MIKYRYILENKCTTPWTQTGGTSLNKIKSIRLSEAVQDILIKETPNSLIFASGLEYWNNSTPYGENEEELPDWLK